MLRFKVVLLAALVTCVALCGCHPRQVATVPPGVDCFTTPKEDSGIRLAENPLPAGFFAPESEPFRGEICFQGNPDNPLDTCVRKAIDALNQDRTLRARVITAVS